MKRHLLFILTLFLSLVANAVEVEIGGLWYNLVAKVKEAEVIQDKNNNKYSGSIVIPETVEYDGNTYSVTSIGKSAFRGCSSLTSITIPNSVTSIGSEAFYKCTDLTSITIPNSVTSIGGGAFRDCTSLTSITIPNSVTSISDHAFSSCSGLTSITIPEGVTSIGNYAFSSCSGLTSITIPNSVTSIGGHAFSGCKGLTSITIPNSVTSIGSYAFYDCSSLTSITIPNSVTSISYGAFNGCSKLTSITIPNSVTSIGEWAFYYCTSLTSITIPNSVTSIGICAFSSCTSLTSITIPNSVTSISNYAFYGCTSLTSITIPNSVTSIGYQAFYKCTGLTAITIGTGIKDIGSQAFASCEELTDVYCYAESVPSTNTDAFDGSYIGYATLHVPASSISSYSTTEPWSKFGEIVSLPSMTYTLTYMIDGQVYKTYTVEYGAAITPEPEPTKEGYTFSGWSEIPDTMPANDVTVTGTFTKDILGTCATPTISYANGKLTYKCETEDAVCQSTITDTDIASYSGNEVDLSVTYTITVYATKAGYENSDVATATLCWIDKEPWKEGMTEEHATEIKALPVLIQAQAGFISLQGLEAGTEVSAYNTSGMLLDTIISSQDTATLRTKLPAGSTAIVKIGQRAVKIMVK